MARHETMPEILYQRHLHLSERLDMSGVAARIASEAERLEVMPDGDRETVIVTMR